LCVQGIKTAITGLLYVTMTQNDSNNMPVIFILNSNSYVLCVNKVKSLNITQVLSTVVIVHLFLMHEQIWAHFCGRHFTKYFLN